MAATEPLRVLSEIFGEDGATTMESFNNTVSIARIIMERYPDFSIIDALRAGVALDLAGAVLPPF